MANRYWITTAGGLWNSTANWSTTSGGASGASVPGSSDSVFFDQAGTYSVTVTSQSCLDLNVSAGTVTFTGTASAFGVYGNVNLTVPIIFSTVTLSLNGASGSPALRTILTSGTTFEGPVTVDSGASGTAVTWKLLDNFTAGTTRLFTLSAGKWDINGFTFSTGKFISSSATALRAINFGAAFYLTGSATVWDTSTTITTGTLTVTGTPLVTVLNATATATTISTGALAEANAISFKLQGGTYVATFSSGSTFKNFELAGPAMTNVATITIYGNFTITGGSISNGGTMTFGATSGTQTITTNTNAMDQAITINGVGGTVQLADAMTMGATRTLTLTNGTLNLNNQTLTTGFFSSSNANTRVLAFGSTGILKLNAAGGTLWTTATNTNFSYTGTSNVTIDNSGAVATTLTPGTLTEAQALNFNIISGTYALTVTNTASFKNLNFVNTGTTGFAGTLNSHTADISLYGNLTLSSGMTVASSTLGFLFAATSGTQLITSNTKTIDHPLAMTGAGGTTKLADALAMGTTRTFNFNNGTFDGNSQSITGPTTGGLAASGGGIVSIKGINAPAVKFTHSSSTLTFTGDNTVAAYTFTLGTLDLNGYKLTCTTFNSNNSNVRTLAFGSTGNVTCTGSGTGLWDTSGSTNLTVTGTPVVTIANNSATAATVSSGPYSPAPETQAISFKFTTGTYALTFLGAAGYVAKDVDFTGFGGSWVRTVACTMYGSLTLSSIAGFTLTGATGILTFGATSGTQIITSNGKTFSCALTVDGVGGTTQLADTLTLAATGVTLKNGTFDANNKTLSLPTGFSVGGGSVVVKNISSSATVSHSSGTLTLGTNISFGTYQLTSGTLDLAGFTLTSNFSTGVGTKNITFNGGTFLSSSSGTPWNNANPTGFTTTAGTGTGKISLTSASIKTFAGGGSTYNCILSNDGAGALTVSGDNTFLGIANGVSPAAFIFTAGSTQTTGSWTVSGTSTSARVTITSTAAGTAANLVKTGGGTVSSNYLSLKDSAATPSTLTWYASSSIDVSGNSGWIFGGVTVNSGAFFLLM
jgi:hypothetical protein